MTGLLYRQSVKVRRLWQQFWRSGLVRLIADHLASLPRFGSPSNPSDRRAWPSWITFGVIPVFGSLALGFAGLVGASEVPNALLAGVGVLAGLLVQVLAWIAGRIGSLADEADGSDLGPRRRALLTRLSIARANVAYASLVSVVFTVLLGLQAVLDSAPAVLAIVDVAMLLHLAPTLILVLMRINSIGQDDELLARTERAARASRSTAEAPNGR